MTKFIPDCYWPEVDNGSYVSHEAVCVLNTNTASATVNLTFFFEDRPKMECFSITVPGERTTHIRLDKLQNADGPAIPRGVPYALMIESDLEVSLQYTRVDTTQPELAITTTIV